MNYQFYVIAAYLVAFILIGVMFTSSYRKYRKAKRDYLNNLPNNLPVDKQV